MNLEEAYRIVLDDILHNGPTLFQGNYDAKNGQDKFMYGIGTVMEFIAYKADHTENAYEQFSTFFTNNMIESESKIKNNT